MSESKRQVSRIMRPDMLTVPSRVRSATEVTGEGKPGPRRQRPISMLPALFTLGNALCGFMAIFFASRPPEVVLLWGWSPLTFAAAFVFLGMFMDALDGRIARLTRQTSALGAQLDSMADMVSFGVAPAFMLVQLVMASEVPYFASNRADTYFGRTALVVAAIYVACTALRLARFNVQTPSASLSDHLYFKGLPSPGAAGTLCSLTLLHEHWRHSVDATLPRIADVRFSAIAMVAAGLLTAVAMVSRIQYVHVLNRYFNGRIGFRTLTKMVVVALVLAISPRETLSILLIGYALSGPVLALWRKLTGKARSAATTVISESDSPERTTGPPKIDSPGGSSSPGN